MFTIFPSAVRITIESDALDRFTAVVGRIVALAEGHQQAEIDALTQQVGNLTASLQQSAAGLQGSVDQQPK